MPKVRLEFDLPEDQKEWNTANNGTSYYTCLWDIYQWGIDGN